MPVKPARRARRWRVPTRLASEDGFTLMVALGVMLVTSLLLAAAFEASRGDIQLSHRNTVQKQAYYAALAGIQEYEYHLQANPDYWETCSTPSKEVPGQKELPGQEVGEHYEIKLLVASTAPKEFKECSTTSPFASMIQSSGVEANTFRIESIGTAGNKAVASSYATRALVATFHVVGFLNFIYFTQYEDGDPALYGGPKECENYYPKRVSLGINGKCTTIEFADGDTVEGPMHTDDATDICAPAYFGRKEHNPPDTVQINNGVYSGCGNPNGTFYTASGKYEKGEELLTPEGDTTLGTYVKEGGEEFTGVTHIVLNGSLNTMTVTTRWPATGKIEPKTVAWPTNGLVYVRASENEKTPCTYAYNDKTEETDNATEVSKEEYCGNVYVSGTYSKPITIAAEEDLIINGNIYPTSVKTLGEEPTGTDTLGLIAGHYVRVYHPLTSTNCGSAANGKESLENPWIYAAILSTNHSFAVDNYECGNPLGKLNVYGAIAQRFRGVVGIVEGSGYIKNYKYDERLAVDEPPYFLNPINAGWKVARETAPTAG
jgi:Tfp pilus assembly protein PilE